MDTISGTFIGVNEEANAERAKIGWEILEKCGYPAEEECALTDAICSLMHVAATEELDFDSALDTARMHFKAETTGIEP